MSHRTKKCKAAYELAVTEFDRFQETLIDREDVCAECATRNMLRGLAEVYILNMIKNTEAAAGSMLKDFPTLKASLGDGVKEIILQRVYEEAMDLFEGHFKEAAEMHLQGVGGIHMDDARKQKADASAKLDALLNKGKQ